MRPLAFQISPDANQVLRRFGEARLPQNFSCAIQYMKIRLEPVPIQAATSTETGGAGNIHPFRSAAVASTGGKGLEK